ncbi:MULTISPECIES: TonB-dependent receptor [unclassified Brevundimonas]|uniref:TonB-dependent receptor n=1 Tax=unclassified Brevundimonas TaxID=2622653 RepID=UPI0025C2F73B|nr:MULTISPECIES: TonB-dependent receptor [unclassified Brevundimonas]
MKIKMMTSACAGALSLVAFAAPAWAEDQTQQTAQEAASEVGEVVVTATRRATRLQDVPLSITAFSQQELTKKGIVGYEGLARETPGVVLNKPTANFNNFTARGIATNGYNANLQSSVAIYIDELPISTIGNTTVIDPTLFDVERVEFLRGPQGTLFGSGSLAGALRILTKAPELDGYSAGVLVDYGMTGADSFRQRYNTMVNVPLIEDELALRVVAFHRDEEGYTDNLGTGITNSNTLKNSGVRASMLWKPMDRFSLRGTASYEESTPEDSGLIDPSLGRNKRVSDRPDIFSGVLTTGNVTAEYQFNGAKLTSSSTLSQFDQKFYLDLAGTFGGAIAFALDADAYQRTFVQEMRLASDAGGKFDWVVGGFYLKRRLDVDYFYRSNPEFLAASGITGLQDEYYQRMYTHTNSHELAAFGELTYRFNDNFWVTGGMRYGEVSAQGFTEEGGFNSNYLVNALYGISGPLTITPIEAATGLKAEGSKPSFKVSATWKPSADLTTYATISTGFRTPIVNAYGGRPSVVDPDDLIIPDGAASDDLTNYEIGLKGRFLEGKLYANLAAYYIDWSNIQVQANRVSDSVQFATNIGKAESKGVEFELRAFPLDGLSLGLNGSFGNSKVTELTPEEAAISGAVLGARLSSPKFQGSFSVDYRFALPNDMEGNASVVVQHVGDYPGLFPNVPGQPGVVQSTYGFTDAYENVNASFAIAKNDLTIGFYVENVFDDHSVTYVHPEAFLASRFGTMRPRTFGVRVGYEF